MIPFFGNSIDFPFLPPGVNSDVQVFHPLGSSQWQRWIKQRGVTMVAMIAIGGAGGGGGGFSGATTTARGGGSGGGAGGVSFHIFPAFVLPDVLIVQPGAGGQGGGAGNNGGSGTSSFIQTGTGITSSATRPNLLVISNPGNAGQTGANSGAAAGANGGGVTAKSNQGWAQAYSISTTTAGVNGSAGGNASGAVGADQTAVWNTVLLSGGAGGAGVTGAGTGFAGGNQILQDDMDLPNGAFTPATNYIAGGAAGSGAAAGGNGGSGVSSVNPLIFTGGAGGGSADGQVGGAGGNGGIGCGGGGGGGGTTGGRGGNGGNGIVIITSW